jgi:hypothetical protein
MALKTAARLEVLICKLPVKRIKPELAPLEAELVREVDRCTGISLQPSEQTGCWGQ